jgi:hypothetical protein
MTNVAFNPDAERTPRRVFVGRYFDSFDNHLLHEILDGASIVATFTEPREAEFMAEFVAVLFAGRRRRRSVPA